MSEVLTEIMSIYRGEYNKTFEELEDAVNNQLKIYEKKLDLLNARKNNPNQDIRLRNMEKSAYDLCRNTVTILSTLKNDLRDEKQIKVFKEKRNNYLEKTPVKVSNSRKANTQTKLF